MGGSRDKMRAELLTRPVWNLLPFEEASTIRSFRPLCGTFPGVASSEPFLHSVGTRGMHRVGIGSWLLGFLHRLPDSCWKQYSRRRSKLSQERVLLKSQDYTLAQTDTLSEPRRCSFEEDVAHSRHTADPRHWVCRGFAEVRARNPGHEISSRPRLFLEDGAGSQLGIIIF